MSEFRSELFNFEKHYETVRQWWTAQGWPEIPASHLSETGIVIYCGDKMACAGWVYQTDSAFALFEWIVADPEIRKQDRSDALSLLIDTAKEVALGFGHVSIFMTVKNESFLSRLEKKGFVASEKGMTNMIFNSQGGK